MPRRRSPRGIRAYRRNTFRRDPSAVPVPIAAPFGGLNTRDPLDGMAPTDAVLMDNWEPGIGQVAVRSGATTSQSAVGSGNVDTIAEYHSAAVHKLLAASNGNIYDATGSPSSLASGFSLNRWQTATLGGSQGWVNGTDACQVYDGSTVGAMSLSGGITTANVIGIMTHRSRSYMFEDVSDTFWYSAVNAMGGAMTAFDLGNVGIPGNIVCIGTINMEGGSDVWGGGGVGNDLAVFVMSGGEIVVYDGDDPGSNWNLVGVYVAAPPIDVRGIARYGRELFLLTKEGVIGVARLMQRGRFDQTDLVTDRIKPTIQTATNNYAANTGWQITVHQTDSRLLLNVPVSATVFEQYVMNLQTGAWGKWLDLPARSWGVYSGSLYFGSTGAKVIKMTGTSDDGTAVASDIQTAFSRLGDVVNVNGLRPVLKGTGQITIGFGAKYDYDTSPVSTVTRTMGPTSDAWDSVDVNWEDWDEADWEGNVLSLLAEWWAVNGSGYAASIRAKASTSDVLSWESSTLMVEVGSGGMG